MPKAPTTIHGVHPGFAAAEQKNNQTKNRINNLGNSRTNSQQSSASKSGDLVLTTRIAGISKKLPSN